MSKQYTQPQSFFPPLSTATPEGLLAYGFTLNPSILLDAYNNGIFPWYTEDDPVLWWSPPTRSVLYPDKMKISASLKQSARKYKYQIRFNHSFEQVMRACAETPRKDGFKTWIREEMIEAYTTLHELGYAMSVATFCGNEMVGGLYGVTVYRTFVGESMFSRKTDASKFALWKLCEYCILSGIRFIDGQLPSPHLASLGFVEVSRKKYMKMLKARNGREMDKIRKANEI